jgi:hypothetical protein
MITAQSADGVLHQFPDGTDPAVVDKAIKDYTTNAQPSTLQDIAASPVGRFLHDAVLPMVEGPAKLMSGGYAPAFDPVEKAYSDALAAQHNRPGYSAARTKADANIAGAGGSGITDELTSSLNPSLSGVGGAVTGMFGSGRASDPDWLDSSNAAADAQTGAQADFQSRHPYLSAATQALGGALLTPDRVPTPAVAAPAISPSLVSTALPKVAQKAADYVGGLMKSAKVDPAALTQASIDAGTKPVTAAEAIGRPGTVGLGALARRAGTTPDVVNGVLSARDAAAPQRILGDYAAAAGIDPAAAQGNLEAFVDANQAKAAPLYKGAYDANQSISSPAIDRILATPAGKQAMNDARTMMQNDQTLMGVPDPDLLEQARDSGQDIPWTGGVASGLKLRSLDYVKRAMGDQIDAAYRGGANTQAGILTGLKNRLTSALDAADTTAAAGPNSLKPEGGLYAQARATAGDYLGAQEQFANGQNFILNDKIPADMMQAHMAQLGPSDADAFKGGVANRLFNVAQSGKLGPQIFKAPIVQQKLAAVMGPEQADAFLANIQKEAQMAGASRFMKPGNGSPTATFNAAMNEQDGATGVGDLALNTVQNVANNGVKGGLVKTAGQYLVQKPLDYLRTRGMSIPVRDEAGRLLTMSPADLATYMQQPGRARTLPGRLQMTPATQSPYGLFGSSLSAIGQQQNQ